MNIRERNILIRLSPNNNILVDAMTVYFEHTPKEAITFLLTHKNREFDDSDLVELLLELANND